MKLILTHEVSGLGAPGDVIEVKDGYARNYLIPRGLATGWTKGGQKQVDSIRAARTSREIANLEDAQALKTKVESAQVVVHANAGGAGRLFGAVTPADVAAAVKDSTGSEVDKRKVEIPQPIRTLGEYPVKIRLHPEVLADLTIEVCPAS
ncbi:MAG: 50S ribosomal protein L9 [Micrococcales bacterium]|nr:MAG: 50S ribosomal protein L9 [Micrococcales bacterium]PIE26333.1 MAG: 50S ribosomal protein L9 [Micrococcales bacterium]